MPDLVAFQRRFSEQLIEPGDVADTALRRALAIHRNTSFASARGALLANFPVVAELVGGDAFDACSHAFVATRPPTDARLCLYGEGFAEFVGGWRYFADHPYLEAVARLERGVVEALFARDAVALEGASIADHLDLDLPMRVHPATRILAFAVPAASIWLAHVSSDGPDALAAINWAPEIALVTRPGDQVHVRVADDAIMAFLAAPTVGAAAMAAFEACADVAETFSAVLEAGALTV